MVADELPDPPGLDLAGLAGWLPTVVPVASGRLSAALIAGGKSNLTYRVGDGTSSWVVRRPPLGHVLATAHDMSREFRVMSALQGTGVPVPRTYGLCEDQSVVGAPFYVMADVAGHTYRLAAELAVLGPVRTRLISTGLVDTLAALHGIDPAEVGLGEFGRPEGFLARQVQRWKQQLDASYTRDLPAADELYARLVAAVPAGSVARIVHGDYRLDNVIVADDDRPAAVIDWEMATLGDPLTDLALLVVYGRLAGVASGGGVADAATAAGYLSETEVIDRYIAGSARDLSGFGFYLALACFKLAAILEGIHYRYLHGLTVGEGFAGIGEAIHPLLDGGLSALKERP